MNNGYEFWQLVDALNLNKYRTAKALAFASGLDYSKIKQQRTDNRIPKAEDLLSLARSLGTSVEYLLTGEDSGAHYSRTVAEIADHLMTLPLDRVLMIRDMVMALEGSTSTSEARKA